jgi:hypothetical protein
MRPRAKRKGIRKQAPPGHRAGGNRANLPLVLLAVVSVAPLAWFLYAAIHRSVTDGIEKEGQYTRVDLRMMGNFPFDETHGTLDDVPMRYRALDGQKVQLDGQMYSDISAAAAVDRFQLVYSIENCCFRGPPRVQERVFAHVPNADKAPLYPNVVRVYGILHTRLTQADHRIVSVYDLDVERVEPAN